MTPNTTSTSLSGYSFKDCDVTILNGSDAGNEQSRRERGNLFRPQDNQFFKKKTHKPRFWQHQGNDGKQSAVQLVKDVSGEQSSPLANSYYAKPMRPFNPHLVHWDMLLLVLQQVALQARQYSRARKMVMDSWTRHLLHNRWQRRTTKRWLCHSHMAI